MSLWLVLLCCSLMKILIVNDSPVLTAVIKAIVETESDLKVVATAANGVEAVSKVSQFLPDLVLMDIHMPKMGGVEATQRIIRARAKTRVLITTATVKRNMKYIFDALQLGALDYVRTPSLSYAPGTEVTQSQLSVAGAEMLRKIRTVLRVSDDKVVASHQGRHQHSSERPVGKSESGQQSRPVSEKLGKRMLAIGCSTGGPTTLAMLLSHLHRPFPVPILVCQHIDAEFTHGFVTWLTEQTGLRVMTVKDRMQPEAGVVYVAPGGDINLEVSAAGRLMLTTPKPDQVYLPNINQLFFSMAEHLGKGACGVVLTGMGHDGAAGLAAIQAANGRGFVQSLDSAVVDSMPRAAQQALGRSIGYPPPQLAHKINEHYFGKGAANAR